MAVVVVDTRIQGECGQRAVMMSSAAEIKIASMRLSRNERSLGSGGEARAGKEAVAGGSEAQRAPRPTSRLHTCAYSYFLSTPTCLQKENLIMRTSVEGPRAGDNLPRDY